MTKFVLGFVLAIIAAAGFYVLPWKIGDWGTVVTRPASTITVIGEGRSKVQSQVASFSVGINILNDDKQKAVDEVNKKISEIISATMVFGVKEEDIKTQSLSVSQNEESYYEDGRQKYRPGQWRVGNTVEITLRDAVKAGDLATMLSKTGATNVYGPNFSLEDTQTAANKLLGEAVDDAWKKAESLAKAGGKKILKVVSITEGSYPTMGPMLYGYGAGGGGSDKLEPGMQTVSKQVTVVFEVL